MNYELLRHSQPIDTRRLVLLHGWGADADDLMPLGQELIDNQKHSIELVSLRAPQTQDEGVGRQWYKLFPAEWSEVPDAIYLLKERLEALATIEIPLDKTVLLGFSQGGAMAINAGTGLPLAGVIGCSAYPHPDWRAPKESPPVLLVHGREDDLVPYAASEKLIGCLNCGINQAKLLSFSGGHCIPQELIPAIKEVIRNWFK